MVFAVASVRSHEKYEIARETTLNWAFSGFSCDLTIASQKPFPQRAAIVIGSAIYVRYDDYLPQRAAVFTGSAIYMRYDDSLPQRRYFRCLARRVGVAVAGSSGHGWRG